MKFYTVCPICKKTVREMTDAEYVKHWDGQCNRGGTPSVRKCHICKSPYADFSTASSITCWGCKQRAAVEAARAEEKEAAIAVCLAQKDKWQELLRSGSERVGLAPSFLFSLITGAEYCIEALQARGKETA